MAFRTGSLPNVVGGSYQGSAAVIDAERTVNLFPQFGVAQTAVKNALIPRPAFQPFVQLPSGPIRAIFWQDGRGFAVSGDLFCEFFATQTFLIRGIVPVDGNLASICSNGTNDGHQIAIVSGGDLCVFDLNTSVFGNFTAADLFPAPALGCAFLQGYVIAWQRSSPLMAGSALFDATDWKLADGAFFAQMQLTVDNIVNAYAYGGMIAFIGSKNTQFWSNTGANDIPLQPIPSAIPAWGLVPEAPFSLAGLDNTIFGIGQNADGSFHAIVADGASWDVISTPYVSQRLASAPSLQGTVAYSYAQDGHPFYVVTVPGLDTSLVYDRATKLWHERGHWQDVQMDWIPDLGSCHAYGFGRHLIGDRQSGVIYQLDPSVYQDQVVLS